MKEYFNASQKKFAIFEPPSGRSSNELIATHLSIENDLLSGKWQNEFPLFHSIRSPIVSVKCLKKVYPCVGFSKKKDFQSFRYSVDFT